MLSLTDRPSVRAAARDPTLDLAIRAVLRLRYEQMGGAEAHFHVVREGDTLAVAEAAVGWPMTLHDAPGWEWMERHPGGVTEVAFVLSDDGPAQVLIVPDGVCPQLTDLLREHADG